MEGTQRKTADADIIAEASGLLSGRVVSPNQAMYAEGKRVSVLATPFWADDEQTFSIRITFDAYGYRVDWERTLIYVESQSGYCSMPFLNARGCTVVSSLPVGDYTLSVPDSGVRVEEPLPTAREDGWIRVFRISEDRVKMTVECTERGELIMAAETREKRYANATVPFQLLDVGRDRVRVTGKIVMRQRSDDLGLYEGRWTPPTPEEALKCSEPEENELVFCVIPQS